VKLPFWRKTGTGRAIERARDRLYRMAYAWCHDPALADDLAQAALEKALRRSGQLRDAGRLVPWLMAILANAYRDHLRAQREMLDIDGLGDTLPSDAPGPEDNWSAGDVARQVRREVARLPAGHRQVVTLVDLEGCSYAEVGAILGIPVGTVMSRLCRARRALRQRLRAVAPDRVRERLRVVK
jgi:RNA polymerase sigma-70 factor (ECF subfamily)